MNFTDLLKETMEHIMKGDKKVTSELIACFLKERGWPSNLNKNTFIKYLQNISNEKIEFSPDEALLDILTSTKRSAIKISLEQKSSLKDIIKVIQNSHTANCEHKNLGVAIFMHGGGFTPISPLPELICTSCGLNITITHKLTPKNCGLKVSSTHIGELMDWAKKCLIHRENHQKFPLVEDMMKNPIKAYKESYFKFSGELKIQIVNHTKMQLASGT